MEAAVTTESRPKDIYGQSEQPEGSGPGEIPSKRRPGRHRGGGDHPAKATHRNARRKANVPRIAPSPTRR